MNTPKGNRIHIGIFGQTNSGKSTVFNLLLNSEIATVSNIKGTTTDSVSKAAELPNFGAVTFVDTAGLGDDSVLGEKRTAQTKKALDKIDLGIYLIIPLDFDEKIFLETSEEFKKRDIKLIKVISKGDLLDSKINENNKKEFQKHFKDEIIISKDSPESILNLKKVIIDALNEDVVQEKTLLEGLEHKIKSVLLVIPIDSASPKGRLILPQAQLIRECLDKNIICTVINDEMLENFCADSYSLVVTDSRIFKFVNSKLNKQIPLTTFSILFARQKGDLKIFLDGVNKIKNLKDGDNILIAENCHHTKNHEDIGTVVIPERISKMTGKNLNFDFLTGHDYSADLEKYTLVINCGGCMITRKNMENRINKNMEKNIPITNYGMVLAYVAGDLDRSIAFFDM